MQGNEKEHDNLTLITGIGSVRQNWLAETFGVNTYADLATLSAEEIGTRLTADGKPYSSDEVELWIQEAAELAAMKEKPDIELSVEPTASVPANSPVEDVEPVVTVAANAGGEKWQRIALFQVEYQKRRSEGAVAEYRTLINYHDIDKSDKWAYIETEEIGGWIVEQAGDNLRPEVEEVEVPAVKPKTEQKTAARLSVAFTGVRLYQPAGMEVSLISGKNGRPSFGVIQAGLPFVLETDIELSVEGAHNGEWEIPYQAQFYARNRKTGEKIHLGDAEPDLLVSGEVASASLRQITLPASRYHLQILVTAEQEDVAPGYFEVPVLEVV